MSAAEQRCFHCDLPVPTGVDYTVEIEHQQRPMCCPGCQAVAQAIVDNGLTDFYKYRTDHSSASRQLVPEELENLNLYDKPEIQKNFVRSGKGNVKQASLILEGIVCAACVWLSERHVMQLPGVSSFSVNYSTHRASVEWDDEQIKLSDILKAISAIGYLAHPLDPNRQEQIYKKEKSLALRRIAVAGLGAMQVMMLAVALYAGDYEGMDQQLERFLRWISLIITTPVLLYSAKPFFVAAWRDVKMHAPGMDVPVALAIGSAYIASFWATASNSGQVYYDSVTMFTFFLLTGRYLEMTARQRAGRAAEELVKLIPAMATRIRNNTQETVAVTELETDDVILVKPGESIPADSVVLEGKSSVDESLLTGESLPVVVAAGSTLVAGSVNIESSLKLKVTATGQDTVLASIQRLLERAQTEKPQLAQLADKVASYFVIAILLLALVVGLYWWQYAPDDAFWIVISMLVVTCPCALSLATPTALTAAIGRLTKLGMLTTRGHALETLAKVTHIVFDKTGTLTEGHLELSKLDCYGEHQKDEVLKIAASVERFSEHPIAKSLIHAYAQDDYYEAKNIQNEPGQGLTAHLLDQTYYLGRPEFIQSQIDIEIDKTVSEQPRVLLANEHEVLAAFEFSDQVRANAAQTIYELEGLGVHSRILSGDRQQNVTHLAEALGIDKALGGLSPQNKLEQLTALQEQGAVVAMVGDGINDAPVLSRAQVSVAMGQGTQIAQASADMVLLSNDLQHLVSGIEMARRTRAIIRQNLLWALLYNLVALPMAAAGWIVPWMAAIGMSASSLIVVLNALRLTRIKTATDSNDLSQGQVAKTV